jgi:hypothetical protein
LLLGEHDINPLLVGECWWRNLKGRFVQPNMQYCPYYLGPLIAGQLLHALVCLYTYADVIKPMRALRIAVSNTCDPECIPVYLVNEIECMASSNTV